MATVRFFKVDCGALHFHTGSLKINIFKVLFSEGGGHKKEYSVYAFDSVDTSGRPLSGYYTMCDINGHDFMITLNRIGVGVINCYQPAVELR